MNSSHVNEATRLAALLSRLRDQGECETPAIARPKELSYFRRNRALALHTERRAYSRPIRSTGLWRNIGDLASINRKPRKRISRLAIRSYWADCLWRKPWAKFDSPEECLEADYCFACGMLRGVPTDRCHIVARVWGGQDEVANLHLLCPLCHEMSEDLDGLKYWRWLRTQSTIRAECWGAARMLWISNFSGDGIDLELHEVWDLSTAYIRKIRPNAVCHMKQHYLSLLESDNSA